MKFDIDFSCKPHPKPLVLSLSMGSVGVHIVCVGLGILGLIAGIVTCIVPKWKVSAFVGNNIVTAQVEYLRNDSSLPVTN